MALSPNEAAKKSKLRLRGALIRSKIRLRRVRSFGASRGDPRGDAMDQPRRDRPLINERRHPYIVELAVPVTGLKIDLNRQIVGFHKSRRIQPRHGRRSMRDNQTYSRWCFSDLPTARAFAEQFGGAFYKITATRLKAPTRDEA